MPHSISNAINSVDLCVSASLEFDVIPQADCVTAVMQQGEIYESAGVVIGERSTVSLLQGDTGHCLASQSRYSGFLILQQSAACCGHTSKLRMKGNHVSTSML